MFDKPHEFLCRTLIGISWGRLAGLGPSLFEASVLERLAGPCPPCLEAIVDGPPRIIFDVTLALGTPVILRVPGGGPEGGSTSKASFSNDGRRHQRLD